MLTFAPPDTVAASMAAGARNGASSAAASSSRRARDGAMQRSAGTAAALFEHWALLRLRDLVTCTGRCGSMLRRMIASRSACCLVRRQQDP